MLCGGLAGIVAGELPGAAQPSDLMSLEARSRVSRFDMILEAEVMRSNLTRVEMNGQCEWLTELWLRPTEMIWGRCEDESLRVLSAALPARYKGPGGMGDLRAAVADSKCRLDQIDEFTPALPGAGSVGLFHLQDRGPVEGQMNLGAVGIAFLSREADGSVTVPAVPGQGRVTWQYKAFVDALHAAAASQTLDQLLQSGDFVAKVRFGSWDERERSRNMRTGEHLWRLPLVLERVYVGAAEPDSCGLVLRMQPAKSVYRFNPAAAKRQRDEAQRIALAIQDFATRRTLVVGYRDSTDVLPRECLEIDAADRVVLRRATVANGEARFQERIPLEQIEVLLDEVRGGETGR